MTSRRQFTVRSSAAPTPDPAAELVASRHRAELAAMRHRAELAEQRVELLERHLADIRTAIRMLEARPQ